MSIWFITAAVALAVASLVYAWRLHRAEQQRSAARIAALAAAIDGTSTDGTSTEATRAPMFSQGSRLGGDILTGAASHVRPLLKVAVGFGMAVGIIVLIAMSGDRREAPAAVPTAASSSERALELLSMRHEREGTSFTVTGLVRNPADAAPGAIMAVVFAFDRDGDFVASGRAPLEFATIAQGDESPFQVTIPDVENVGRYRVSFRTSTGVVRHVDKRDAAAAATAVQAARAVMH